MWRLGGEIIDQRLPPHRVASEKSRDNKDWTGAERKGGGAYETLQGVTGQMKCAAKQKGSALKRSRQLWLQLCSSTLGEGSRSPIYKVKRDQCPTCGTNQQVSMSWVQLEVLVKQ